MCSLFAVISTALYPHVFPFIFFFPTAREKHCRQKYLVLFRLGEQPARVVEGEERNPLTRSQHLVWRELLVAQGTLKRHLA